MTDNHSPDLAPAALDELFMSAIEGDTAALGRLRGALGGAPQPDLARWPGPLREAWHAGAELLLDDEAAHRGQDPEFVALLHDMAMAGYESRRFRDTLAAVLRSRFAAYADPAGMIAALGVLDVGTPPPLLARRWDLFALLAEGRRCLHPAHGLGTIEEIDGVASEVRIAFGRGRPHVLALGLCLESIQIIRPDSPLDAWLAGRRTWDAAITADHLLAAARDSLCPPECDAKRLTALLVPAVVPAASLAACLSGERPAGESTAAAGPAAPQRALAEARSLIELEQVLQSCNTTDFPEADRANADELIAKGAPRDDQAACWRDTVARLWHLDRGADWLVELLRRRATDAYAWADRQRFADLSDEMAGRLVGDWFRATATAVGAERFAALAVALPLRLWTPAENALAESDGDAQLLFAAIAASIRSGETTADMLAWMWRSDDPAVRAPLHDLTTLLRTLGKPVRGAYIKAHRDFRKLLVKDEDFHAFLLAGRDADELDSLAHGIERAAELDSGEKQTLIVRLVRVAPQLRAIVERRAGAKTDAGGPAAPQRVTSIRSYERRRRELEDIISVRIPANSRALAHARGYGDLSENFEFKAAKEEQRLLTARRGELERDLGRVRPADFSTADSSQQVVPGCTVVLRAADGAETTYHLLGLWDSLPDRNMIAYDTPLGRAVMGRRRGDAVTLPTGQTATLADVRPLADEVLHWLNDGEAGAPQAPAPA